MSFRRGAAALLLAGCLEYSPHAIPDEERHRDVHRKSLEALRASPPREPLRFAVLGDTQLNLDETARAIAALRARDDLAFVAQIGDFTHLGLSREYELTNDLFLDLGRPYFVAVGVHDLLGNGGDVFQRMFGPRNFAFAHAGVRFVFLDTNSVQVGHDGSVPDLAWLAAQLAPGAGDGPAVVFSHVDPTSSDFDQRLRDGWSATLREGGVAISFHGHAHRAMRYDEGGVLHVVLDELQAGTFLVVSRRPDGGLDLEEARF